DNGILKYIPGNSYDYVFDSILTVGLSSGVISESDDTSLKVSGVAKIFSKGNCGYILQLNAVKVSNAKESVEKKILNSIQKPVLFTLVSGELEPQICTDSNDLEYSLNIKRGIISLLQTGATAEHEVDVFGQCPTLTSTSKIGNTDTITKVRNLNNCAYREHINSGLISGVVNEKAGITSNLLLEANYVKESKVVDSVVESVQLTETYKFVGSAKGKSDVNAKVFTTIKLKNASGTKANSPTTGTIVKSLIFQKPETHTSKNINSLKTTLSDLVELTGDYVKKDSAKKFVEFIRLLRQADTDTLLELASFPHPNKVLARKVYLDGIFRTNTAESARAILKQIGKLDEKEKVLAALSLNLVKNVDKETLIQAASQLLPNAPNQLYLSVGSLVADFCSKNTCNGVEIEAISKKFIDGLKHCKANTKRDEERIVFILKSIGNSKILGKNTVGALNECVSTGRSNRIRVAALQAISTVACDGTLQSKSLELLKDQNEDSELRIEAYLAAISCPNAELANHISEIVNSEKVYQVGSFITSNLKAIRDSTEPSRELQKYHLANIRVTKQFPNDFRRYSFNNEISYNINALGVGASSDYKVIYSQHGFLPRSSRINVTTEVFGTNFNVFEASIRQENVESVLEYYLGPKGLLNKDFDEIVKLIEVGTNGRARRSIVDDTVKVSKKYKNYGSKTSQDINLDLSLKLFGSELAFLSLGDNIPSTLDEIINNMSDAFEKSKKELSSFEKQFAHHHLFLDTELAYPTSIGIPLELVAQGFASTKLDLAANIDINAILEQNWQRAKYRLKFIPSVDLNVNLQVGFNAQVLNTGLRIVTTAHSATGNDVTVALINDSKGFTVDVELPREKIEFININVNPELFVAEQDKHKIIPLKSSKKNKNSQSNELCFNQLEIVGLNVCVVSSSNLNEIQTVGGTKEEKGIIAADQFYLSKPFSFAIYMTAERKFSFKGTYTEKASGDKTSTIQYKLDFATPGSKISHDTSIAVELGNQKTRTYGRLSFDNTQYHFGVEVGLNNDDRELVLYGQYEQDKDLKKSKVGFSKNGNEYKPLIEIQDANGVVNSINGYRADGKIIFKKTGEKLKRFNFENFQVSNGNNMNIIFNGWTEFDPSSIISELRITSDQQSYLVKSNFKQENGNYAAGFFINDDRSPENVYGSSIQLILSEHSYSVNLNGKFAGWSVDTDVGFEFEKDDTLGNLRKGVFKHNANIQHQNKPVGALRIKSDFDINKFDLDAELSREQKVGSLNIKYQTGQKSVQDYSLEVKANLNKHIITISSKRELNGNVFLTDNVVTSSWGTLLSAKGELGQHYSPQDIRIDLEGIAQLSGKEKPTQWVFKIIGTPDKTNSEFKVSRDSAELLKFLSESQHPQDKISSAKVTLNVKNILNAKADFRIAKNGKGDFSASFETQKTEPKHKLEVEAKLQILAPKYDIDTTFTLDGDKKIHFRSENNFEKLKFFTKNLVEAMNKKVIFEANGGSKGELRGNGELQGSFSLTIPDGRVIDGTINRKMLTNAKTGISQGNLDVHISDKPFGSSSKRTIAFEGKLDKLNIKTKEFSANGLFLYTALDGQKSMIDYQIKNVPYGESKNLDVTISANGNPLNQPIHFSISLSEYSVQKIVGSVAGNYGDIFKASLKGNYNNKEVNAPATYEIQTNIQIPKSTLKFIEFNSHGKLLKPSSRDGNGAFNIEFSVDSKTGQGQYGRINTFWKGSAKEGNYDFEAQTNKLEYPLKFNGNYMRGQTGNDNVKNIQKSFFNAQYGKQFFNSDAEISYSANDAELKIKLDSSNEASKGMELYIHSQKSTDNATYLFNAKAKQSDKSYELDAKRYLSEHKKGFNVHVYLPNNKPINILSIVEVLGERKGKVFLELENIAEFDFKLNGEASFVSIDDFYIRGSWNSKKLLLDGYELDTRAQGKSIRVQLKNVTGVIFLGTATYALKNEPNKYIIDGQGQVQYQGKSYNGNFKLSRQNYDINVDKEVGFSFTFNGNFGTKNSVSTIKITNKEFNTKFSICEEKKQCTNIQIQSIVIIDEQKLDVVQHSTLILVDLRELGYPYEFELKSKNMVDGFKYQYNLDSSISSGSGLKYQLTANIQPTISNIKLTLPKRQILLETVHKLPTDGHIFGHYEQSATFYIDKLQRPDDVFKVSALLHVSGTERVALNANGLLKLEHPTIRPLSISGRVNANFEQKAANSELIFDIFQLPEQKVIGSTEIRHLRTKNGFDIQATAMIKSEGIQINYMIGSNAAVNTEAQELNLNLEYNNGNTNIRAIYFGNKEKIEFILSESNSQIIKVVGVFSKQKNLAKYNAKLQAFDKSPVEIVGEFQPTSVKFILKRQDIFDGYAEVKLGKELKFDASGSGQSLFNGRVALDPTNFLQTNYKINDENVKAFVRNMKDKYNKDTDEIRTIVNQRLEILKRSTEVNIKLAKEAYPDFSKLTTRFETNIKTFIQELEIDPSIAPFIDEVRNLFEKIARITDEITKLATETYEKIYKLFGEISGILNALWKDSVLKACEDLKLTAQKLIIQICDEIETIYTKLFKDFLTLFEKYGPVLRTVGKALYEFLKPINEIADEIIKILVHTIDEAKMEFKQYVEKLPKFDNIFKDLNERVKNLPILEKTLEFLNGVFEQLNIFPLTNETTEFLQKLHDYLDAKLKEQSIDNEKSLTELFKLLVKSLQSIWVSIKSSGPRTSPHIVDYQTWFGSLPQSVDFLAKLPGLLSFRSSLFNFMLNENWEDVFSKDLLNSWIFFNDFELRGHIVDGQHIFTFDGQHFVYPGNCKYILAQDSVDNNFTVIAQITNGKLKGITLIDRDGNYADVAENAVLKVNGNLVEYPQHVSELHAWRRFYTVHLHSEYGVSVVCTTDLKVCHVNINGFYTSKTRGLFGNGNAEPYDDYVQIDGTLAADSTTFGNDYGVGKCPAVTVSINQVDSLVRSEICSEIFGIKSSLSFNFLSVDYKPYRKACDISLAKVAEKDKEAAACTFALAYGSAVKQLNKWVLLPSRCIKCAGTGGQRELGDEFTVKLPNNKADIVFVVDINVTPTVLDHLIAPAITDLRETLKSRGFTDVQIGVIVFDESKRYPALLTSDNGKLNYKGNLAGFKLNGINNFCDSCVEQIITEKRFLTFYNYLKHAVNSIVPQADEKAFHLALDYPFRAGAAKSIIGVRSESLEYNNLLKFVRAQLTGSITKFDGALLHLIAPVKAFALEGVPSEKLIGFNTRLIATLDGKDNKKRSKLQFDNDMGIEFVLNNGGWVFATQHFHKLKLADQKKMITQVTSSIADTLFKTEIISDCRCEQVHGLHGQHKCAIRSSTFLPNKKPKAT
ncbi:hypothetical protein KR018_005510, partial [Drosophila ironensis]